MDYQDMICASDSVDAYYHITLTLNSYLLERENSELTRYRSQAGLDQISSRRAYYKPQKFHQKTYPKLPCGCQVPLLNGRRLSFLSLYFPDGLNTTELRASEAMAYQEESNDRYLIRGQLSLHQKLKLLARLNRCCNVKDSPSWFDRNGRD
ncbi:hypothetical protein VTK73DRAFT_2674 [Phialemonium thermophilum]|uniref:Uncharacterized protein n=1 Tax=Phialemonium thermophilum TaxID=223376 RepID=A0ABR3X3H5_9PEZI